MSVELGTELFRVKDLGCSWNGVKILNGCTFTLERGQITVLCGPNGSGKSTLMSLLAGIEKPGLKVEFSNQDSGIFLNEEKIQKYKRKELSRKISFLSQTESFMWTSSVKDIVVSGRYPYTNMYGHYKKEDYEIAEKVIETVKIDSLANKDISCLSGGELQKVRIARCLCQEPQVLLLDEPLANLDFSYESDILDIIKNFAREKNAAVLVSIHDLNLAARVADKLIFLKKAEPCLIGLPDDLLDEKILKSIYNCEFGTFVHPGYGKKQIFLKDKI